MEFKEGTSRKNQINTNYYHRNKEIITIRRKEKYPEIKDKICQDRKTEYRLNPEKFIFRNAKNRAKRKGVLFEIDISDITIPEFCPVLGIKLEISNQKFSNNSPTLDRLIPNFFSCQFIKKQCRGLGIRSHSERYEKTMILKDGTFIVDTEGDGFQPSKFHCISVHDGENVFSTSNPDQMKDFFKSAKTLIGHNIQRADVPWIERLTGVSLEDVRIIDTLPLSWALFPDADGHGLYDWGRRLSIPKVEILDWVNLPVEKYIERCEQDVRINLKLWEIILDKLTSLYGNPDDLNRYIDYLSFKMKCARIQEQNKWKVDLKYAHEELSKLIPEREKRLTELATAMPKVPVVGIRTAPKRMYNKEGLLTKLGESWFEQLEQLNLPPETQEIEFIKSYEEPNPGSNQQLKEWLFSLGWKPITFKQNAKKEDIPQINKEKQKGGGVCESVKALYDKEPSLSSLDGLSILNHRIPLLSGFISSSDGGYLSARVAGLTNTLRFIHTEIVNLPKIGLPFADAIRGSLIAEDGMILMGADMSSLEDRLKQHFIYPLDPEYVKTMLRDDYDPHCFLALKAGAIIKAQYDDYVNGINKAIKSIRDTYKNGNYACQYNAYPPRLAITCGISLEKAEQLFEDYWKLNWAIKDVSKGLKVKTIAGEKWLYNPISRFWYSLRKENDRFSTLIQGTASYVFDKWLGNVLYSCCKDRDLLIGQFHDEFIFKTLDTEEARESLENVIQTAIKELNQELKLNRELDVGIQTGKRYSDIH